VKEDTIEMYKEAWLKYDPKGRGFIKVTDFSNLVIDLVE